jgi:hypothetical protein
MNKRGITSKLKMIIFISLVVIVVALAMSNSNQIQKSPLQCPTMKNCVDEAYDFGTETSSALITSANAAEAACKAVEVEGSCVDEEAAAKLLCLTVDGCYFSKTKPEVTEWPPPRSRSCEIDCSRDICPSCGSPTWSCFWFVDYEVSQYYFCEGTETPVDGKGIRTPEDV